MTLEVDRHEYHYEKKSQIERDVKRHDRFAGVRIESLRANA